MYKGTKYHINGAKEYEGVFSQNDNYDIGTEYDINENKTNDKQPTLFSTISLSGLTFRPPE